MTNEILILLVEDDEYKNGELDKRADNLTNCKEVIPIVVEYKAIIRFQKKNILNVGYRKGCAFKKLKESFLTNLWKWLRKLALNLIKILDKYLKLIKFSLSLNFSKCYAKSIKEVFKESGSEFKQLFEIFLVWFLF